MAKMTRRQLIERIAYERAEYELQYAKRPDGWQPLLPFARSAALRLARTHDVDRIQRTEGTYGVSLYARIDWKRLAGDIAPVVARFKRDMIEFDMAPEAVA